MKVRTKAYIRLPISIDKDAIHHKIKTLTTLQEKRDLVQETNPLIHALGDRLLPRNGMDYADYLDKLYIGCK